MGITALISSVVSGVLDWTLWPLLSGLQRLSGGTAHSAIKAEAEPLNGPVFGVTLEQVIHNQGGQPTDAPKVLTALLASIRALGGTEREGIFRITARKEAKRALRRQLDSGDYDIKLSGEGLDEVDIPAGVLREWLRELKEPVIPPAYYGACLDVAKRYQHDITALDREVCAVFATLPHTSQLVLVELTKIVREIDHNLTQTKMNLSNLAMVFAPTLLYTPTEDFDSLVVNNQYEKVFVTALFRAIPV